MLLPPSSRRVRARSTRRSSTKRWTGVPVACLNSGLKCDRLNPATPASSASVQMRLDVLDHVAQPPCRQRAGGRGSLVRWQGEQAYGQRRGKAVREFARQPLSANLFIDYAPVADIDGIAREHPNGARTLVDCWATPFSPPRRTIWTC